MQDSGFNPDPIKSLGKSIDKSIKKFKSTVTKPENAWSYNEYKPKAPVQEGSVTLGYSDEDDIKAYKKQRVREKQNELYIQQVREGKVDKLSDSELFNIASSLVDEELKSRAKADNSEFDGSTPRSKALKYAKNESKEVPIDQIDVTAEHPNPVIGSKRPDLTIKEKKAQQLDDLFSLLEKDPLFVEAVKNTIGLQDFKDSDKKQVMEKLKTDKPTQLLFLNVYKRYQDKVLNKKVDFYEGILKNFAPDQSYEGLQIGIDKLQTMLAESRDIKGLSDELKALKKRQSAEGYRTGAKMRDSEYELTEADQKNLESAKWVDDRIKVLENNLHFLQTGQYLRNWKANDIGNWGKELWKGFGTMYTGAIRGLGALGNPSQRDDLMKTADVLDSILNLEEDPHLRESFIKSIPNGLGSMVGFMLPGALFGGSYLTTAFLGGFSQMGLGYKEAMDMGATNQQAQEQSFFNFLGGLTEMLTVQQYELLKKIGGNFKAGNLFQALGGVFQEGAEEGTQEVLQQFIQNVSGIYDFGKALRDLMSPENLAKYTVMPSLFITDFMQKMGEPNYAHGKKELTDGLKDSFLSAFIVGALTGGGGGIINSAISKFIPQGKEQDFIELMEKGRRDWADREASRLKNHHLDYLLDLSQAFEGNYTLSEDELATLTPEEKVVYEKQLEKKATTREEILTADNESFLEWVKIIGQQQAARIEEVKSWLDIANYEEQQAKLKSQNESESIPLFSTSDSNQLNLFEEGKEQEQEPPESFDPGRIVTLKGGDYGRIGKDYYFHPNGDVTSGSYDGLKVDNPVIIDEVKYEYEKKINSPLYSKSGDSNIELVDRKALGGSSLFIDPESRKIKIAKDAKPDDLIAYLGTEEGKKMSNAEMKTISSAIRDLNESKDTASKNIQNVVKTELKKKPLSPFPLLKMQPENIAQIKAGTKSATSRNYTMGDGMYVLDDGTLVEIYGSKFVDNISKLNNPEAWARAEGFRSLDDLKANAKFNHTKEFAKGNQGLWIYKLRVVDPSTVEMPVSRAIEPRDIVEGLDKVPAVTPQEKALQEFFDVIERASIPYKFSSPTILNDISESRDGKSLASQTFGKFFPQNMSIEFYAKSILADSAPKLRLLQTKGHEGLHRLIHQIVLEGKHKKFNEDLKTIVNDYITNGNKTTDYYGRISRQTTDYAKAQEFLAEIFTNFEMQKELNSAVNHAGIPWAQSIKYAANKGKKLSLFGQFVKLIAKVLGIDVNEEGMLYSVISLVDDTLRIEGELQNAEHALKVKLAEARGENAAMINAAFQDYNYTSQQTEDTGDIDTDDSNVEETRIQVVREEAKSTNNVWKDLNVDGRLLFPSMYSAVEYASNHTYEEFLEYTKDVVYPQEAKHLSIYGHPFKVRAYALLSSRSPSKIGIISYRDADTMVPTVLIEGRAYTNANGQFTSTIERRQMLDDVMDELRKSGINLEIHQISRIDMPTVYWKDDKGEPQVNKEGKKNVKQAGYKTTKVERVTEETIKNLYDAGYIFIPNSNSQYLVPMTKVDGKWAIQGLELTQDPGKDQQIVWNLLLRTVTQNDVKSESDAVKRFNGMIGDSDMSFVPPAMIRKIQNESMGTRFRLVDGRRVGHKEIKINAVILNLDLDNLPEGLKEYFGQFNSGIFGDGAVIDSQHLSNIQHLINMVPISKIGISLKMKRSEQGLFVKAAMHKAPHNSILQDFMDAVGVDRIIIKSALKIGKQGVYKDVQHLSWEDIVQGAKNKNYVLSAKAVINYNISKDAFIQAKGDSHDKVGGVNGSILTMGLESILGKDFTKMVKNMWEQQTKSFFDNWNEITPEKKIEKMNEFIEKNPNLSNYNWVKQIEAMKKIMGEKNVNTLNPIFSEPFVKNVFASELESLLKHEVDGILPVIYPDMGQLTGYADLVRDRLSQFFPGDEKKDLDTLLTDAFTDGGFLRSGYVMLTKREAKRLGITWEKISTGENKIVATVNPPGFFNDMRSVRVIGIIPDTSWDYDGIKIRDSANGVVVSYEDFISRSGKDFDIDTLIMFKNDGLWDLINNYNNSVGDKILREWRESPTHRNKASLDSENDMRALLGLRADQEVPAEMKKLFQLFGLRKENNSVSINGNLEGSAEIANWLNGRDLPLDVGNLYTAKVYNDALYQIGGEIESIPLLDTRNRPITDENGNPTYIKLKIENMKHNLAMMKYLTDLTIDWRTDQRILKLNISVPKLMIVLFADKTSTDLLLHGELLKEAEEKESVGVRDVDTRALDREEMIGWAINKFFKERLGDIRKTFKGEGDTEAVGYNSIASVLAAAELQINRKDNEFKDTLIVTSVKDIINRMKTLNKMSLSPYELQIVEAKVKELMLVNGPDMRELEWLTLFFGIGGARNLPNINKLNIQNSNRSDAASKYLGYSNNGLALVARTVSVFNQLIYKMDPVQKKRLINSAPFLNLFRIIFGDNNVEIINHVPKKFNNQLTGTGAMSILNKCYHAISVQNGVPMFSYEYWDSPKDETTKKTLVAPTANFDDYLGKIMDTALGEYSLSNEQVHYVFSTNPNIASWFEVIKMKTDPVRNAIDKIIQDFIPLIADIRTTGFSEERANRYKENLYKGIIGYYQSDKANLEFGMSFPELLQSSGEMIPDNKMKNIDPQRYFNPSSGLNHLSRLFIDNSDDVAGKVLREYYLTYKEATEPFSREEIENAGPMSSEEDIAPLTDKQRLSFGMGKLIPGILLPVQENILFHGDLSFTLNNLETFERIPLKCELDKDGKLVLRKVPVNIAMINESFKVARKKDEVNSISGSMIAHYGMQRVVGHHLQQERNIDLIVNGFVTIATTRFRSKLSVISPTFTATHPFFEEIYDIADNSDSRQILSDYSYQEMNEFGTVLGKPVFSNGVIVLENVFDAAEFYIKYKGIEEKDPIKKSYLVNQVAAAIYLRWMYDYYVPMLIKQHLEVLTGYSDKYSTMDEVGQGLLLSEIKKYNAMWQIAKDMTERLSKNNGKIGSNNKYMPSFYLPKAHKSYEEMKKDLIRKGMTEKQADDFIRKEKEDTAMVGGYLKPKNNHFKKRTIFDYIENIDKSLEVHQEYMQDLASLFRHSHLTMQYDYDRYKYVSMDNKGNRELMDKVFAIVTNNANMRIPTDWNELKPGDHIVFSTKVLTKGGKVYYGNKVGEVVEVNENSLSYETYNGQVITINKFAVKNINRFQNWSISSKVAELLAAAGLDVSRESVDDVSTVILGLSAKAMLGVKPFYSLLNYVGSRATQMAYFGRINKKLLKDFSDYYKVLSASKEVTTEGVGVNVPEIDANYVGYVLENSEYFLGGVERVLGAFGGALERAERGVSAEDYKWAQQVGGIVKLKQLIDQMWGETEHMKVLFEKFRNTEKERVETAKEIISFWERFNRFWNENGLVIPPPFGRWKIFKETIIGNPMKVEGDVRPEVGIKSAVVHTDIRRINELETAEEENREMSDEEKKKLEIFLASMFYSVADRAQKSTNFMYNPGLSLSIIGSEPLGRIFDMFANYAMNLSLTMYMNWKNLLMQRKEFGHLPDVIVDRSGIRYDIVVDGVTITNVDANEGRRFLRSLSILTGSYLARRLGMTIPLIVGSSQAAFMNAIIKATAYNIFGNSMQMPLFTAFSNFVSFMMAGLLEDEPPKKIEDLDDWKKNRAFWRKLLPLTKKQSIAMAFAELNQEDAKALVKDQKIPGSDPDGIEYMGLEDGLTKAVLQEYNRKLWRDFQPMPLGVWNKFMVDLAGNLIVNGFKPDNVQELLVNQLQTILPGGTMTMGLIRSGYDKGWWDFNLPTNPVDDIQSDIKTINRKINKAKEKKEDTKQLEAEKNALMLKYNPKNEALKRKLKQ